MLILIAESKTMSKNQEIITPEQLKHNLPVFEQQADSIMEKIAAMEPSEVSEVLKVSWKMTADIMKMVYEFPNKMLGQEALKAFTGVVFKALDVSGFNDMERHFTSSHVRIISSLYGWLEPSDIIKPYRLDFPTKIAPGNRSLASFWRDVLTDRLLLSLKNDHTSEILNLLPSEASKCLDWKKIGGVANVNKVDFKIQSGDGILKTPDSRRLKELRGILLRQIIKEGVDDPGLVSKLESENYFPADNEITPGNILFYCD